MTCYYKFETGKNGSDKKRLVQQAIKDSSNVGNKETVSY